MDSMNPFVQFENKRPDGLTGVVYAISGPSGAGKNTLINLLKQENLGLSYIPSFTTRSMREGEYQGNPYVFVSGEEFNAMAISGEFLEYEEVHGKMYGTHLKTYEYAVKNGFNVVKDIDVKGAINLQNKLGDSIVLIYVRPTSLDSLVHRLEGRGDSKSDIEVRTSRIEFEENMKKHFDYVIVNDDSLKAKNELVDIIMKSSDLSRTKEV